MMLAMVRMRTKSQNSHFRNTRLVSLIMCSGSTKKGKSYLMLAMVRTRTKSQNSHFRNTRPVSGASLALYDA
jgi:phosphate starvation-inducible protein PhoH